LLLGERKAWKDGKKINSSMNLGLPIDMEKGRAFTGVHGVDRVVGSGPNTFPVEMAGGNGGIGGIEMLSGGFGRGGGGRGERRRRGGMGAL
jgi:hypothetical protein